MLFTRYCFGLSNWTDTKSKRRAWGHVKLPVRASSLAFACLRHCWQRRHLPCDPSWLALWYLMEPFEMTNRRVWNETGNDDGCFRDWDAIFWTFYMSWLRLAMSQCRSQEAVGLYSSPREFGQYTAGNFNTMEDIYRTCSPLPTWHVSVYWRSRPWNFFCFSSPFSTLPPTLPHHPHLS